MKVASYELQFAVPAAPKRSQPSRPSDLLRMGHPRSFLRFLGPGITLATVRAVKCEMLYFSNAVILIRLKRSLCDNYSALIGRGPSGA